MIEEEVHFEAEMVAAYQEEYTPNFIVHGIFFGVGDPERAGEHWSFTRSLGDDDDGVCTVKELQQFTVYGGIVRFKRTRRGLTCDFGEEAAQVTKVRRLVIDYTIDAENWQSLVEQARMVFDGQNYFEVAI